MNPLTFQFVRRGWLSLLFLFLATGALAEGNLHLDKARALGKQGLWNDAVPAFEKALKQEPGNGMIQANLGVALAQVNRHKEALLAYEGALNKGYDSADFRYMRGLSFLQVNLLDEAATEMERALKMNALMPQTIYDLGLVYTLQGRTEEAMELVKRLYRRNYTLSRKLFKEIPGLYKIAEVDHGGTLQGKVTLTGDRPKPRAFHLINTPNIEFCSRISDGQGHRILHDFQVSQDGGLKDTVIALVGVEKGKPFDKKMKTFHIDRCRASTYAIGIRNGEDILIENTDPIRHEIATYQTYHTKVRQTSHKPVISKSSQVRSAFVKPGSEEFTMKCNLHPFLQTHGLFVDNPYYTVTDRQGKFSIEGIPPGTYEVRAWHPYLPTRMGTVTIVANQTATLDFTFDSKNEKRKLYQNDTKGYRFNTWFDSGEKFYGGKRVDDPVEILQSFDNSERYIEGDNILKK